MAKGKKKGNKSKGLLVVVGIIILAVIGSSLNKKDTDSNKNENNNTDKNIEQTEAVAEQIITESVSETEEQTIITEIVTEKVTEEVIETIYEEDKEVNDFLVRYNKISKSPITDGEKGNVRQKYHGHTYDRWIEILNGADNKFYVTLHAEYEHQDIADLRDAFKDVVITLDSSISEEVAYEEFDKAISDETFRVDKEIGKVTYKMFNTIDASIAMGRIDISIEE